jgi:hypothetical protein
MPKDRTENIDRYKVRGGHLNEFDFARNEGEMAEQEHTDFEHGGEGLHGASEPNAPQNVARRIEEIEQRVNEKMERRRAKQASGGASKKSAAKKSVRKTASRKPSKSAGGVKKGGASKKSAAKSAKKSVKKSAPKKSVSKKGAATKRAAKKSR